MTLIDRDELFPGGVFILNQNNPEKSLEELLSRIQNAHTVDAVPVVRCRDCKHYNEDSLYCGMNSRDRGECFNWYKEDFCSYGERRSGDGQV